MAFTGVTANTGKHLQLDAGAFLKNWDPTTDTWATAGSKIIGATAGGGSFSAIPNIRRIEVDGVKTAVKGFEALDGWEVTLTAKVKEITVDTLKLALAKASSTAVKSPSSAEANNYDKIEAGTELADSDYLTNITWVGRISGSQLPVVIVVKNALCTNGLSLTTSDKAEGVVELTIVGHAPASDVDEVPFEIYYPKMATT